MVERMPRNPDTLPISESEVGAPPRPRHGLCMICGVWVDAEEGDEVYGVTLARSGFDVSEHVSHATCLLPLTHESARLPGTPGTLPANYLASKYRTPSGR
jgi:hypothetical protein